VSEPLPSTHTELPRFQFQQSGEHPGLLQTSVSEPLPPNPSESIFENAAVNMDYAADDALFSFGQSSPWGT